MAFETWVASRLVVAADRADLEAMPRRDRPAVQLEQPEPQPAPFEGLPSQLSVEGRVAEVGRRRAPARPVEGKERVEVTVERRPVRESCDDVAFSADCSLAAPQLLAEVPAPRREVFVPGRRKRERRARLAPPQAAADELRPHLLARQLLTEERVPAEPAERGAEGAGGRGVLAASVDGAEFVTRAVAEEAEDAREAATAGVEGEDGRQRVVGGARGVKQKLASTAEVLPPEPAPERGREDAPGSLCECIPLVLEFVEAVSARRRGRRFPVAITFDDDLACHAEIALPILVRHGATATFFLSGASLERPFAFWYERLQRAHDEQVEELAELVLGETTASGEPPTLHELALAVEELDPDERDAVADRLAAALGSDPETAGIRAGQVRALADAAMTIGFHTRRHDALSLLDDERLDAALVDGREALAEAAGQAVDVIGYPHGRADARVADHARAAGFTAGFSTQPIAVTPDADPLLQGRIAPTFWSVGGLAIQLALTLRRA